MAGQRHPPGSLADPTLPLRRPLPPPRATLLRAVTGGGGEGAGAGRPGAPVLAHRCRHHRPLPGLNLPQEISGDVGGGEGVARIGGGRPLVTGAVRRGAVAPPGLTRLLRPRQSRADADRVGAGLGLMMATKVPSRRRSKSSNRQRRKKKSIARWRRDGRRAATGTSMGTANWSVLLRTPSPLMREMTTRSALTRTSSVLSRGMVTARTITGARCPSPLPTRRGEEQGGPRPRAETTAGPSSLGRERH